MAGIKKFIVEIEPGFYGVETHQVRFELQNYGGKDLIWTEILPTDHFHSMFDRVFERARLELKRELEKA